MAFRRSTGRGSGSNDPMEPRSPLAGHWCSTARIGALCSAALAAATTAIASIGAERFQYESPMPGSAMVSIWNNIAIREGHALDPATLSPDRISVAGESSGAHTGTLALSDDGRTLVFTRRAVRAGRARVGDAGERHRNYGRRTGAEPGVQLQNREHRPAPGPSARPRTARRTGARAGRRGADRDGG